MDTKQEITRRYLREGDSERKIARDLQINRKTVKKYLLEHLKIQQKSEDEGNTESLQEYTSCAPVYNSTGRYKRKLTDEIKTLIQEQVGENDRKKREGLRKQIKRKIDIHEYLLSKGHKIGYTTVCNYICEHEIMLREAFIRQVHLPGEECEFDWGEVKLTIGGEQKRLNMSAFTASSSNYRYGDLYKRQDTLAYMESHNDFFAHAGGIYHEMVYDNMRVAVAEFVGRHEKQPTRALTNLSGGTIFAGGSATCAEVTRRGMWNVRWRLFDVKLSATGIPLILLRKPVNIWHPHLRDSITYPALKLEKVPNRC